MWAITLLKSLFTLIPKALAHLVQCTAVVLSIVLPILYSGVKMAAIKCLEVSPYIGLCMKIVYCMLLRVIEGILAVTEHVVSNYAPSVKSLWCCLRYIAEFGFAHKQMVLNLLMIIVIAESIFRIRETIRKRGKDFKEIKKNKPLHNQDSCSICLKRYKDTDKVQVLCCSGK
eukprot:TRINITY_DN12724_c0_g4_i1.p1 TRINITY_DN12724_c0_g4~~TRINITY_DN12724_c0_g4_i1.p1  ORF type:complete len:172 (-),score=22.30 TRINITY_DN12724_c0_g4_i1:186-701(-)